MSSKRDRLFILNKLQFLNFKLITSRLCVFLERVGVYSYNKFQNHLTLPQGLTHPPQTVYRLCQMSEIIISSTVKESVYLLKGWWVRGPPLQVRPAKTLGVVLSVSVTFLVSYTSP